jgi:hypothetical protein
MNNKKNFKDKEEKQQEQEIVTRLPRALKRHTLSFLSGHSIESRAINSIYFSPFFKESLFPKDKLMISAAHRVAHHLAHRINEEETLAFMQRNPNLLQSFQVPIQIKDPHGRLIKRNSIIGILVALDEFCVIATTPETKPYDLISIIFSWFDNAKNPRSCHVKKQLQEQLAENCSSRHTDASKQRRDHYLQEIEIFIKKIIQCGDISNDSNEVPFEKLLELPLVQDFIENAFRPIPNDNGEFGIVWDLWQLNLDYISLLKTYINNDNVPDKSRPNLGDGLSRKADVVNIAVRMAFQRSSQFCHLEVYSQGVNNVSEGKPPPRLDCTDGLPGFLDGIAVNFFFSFYSSMWVARGGLVDQSAAWERTSAFIKFLSNKNSSITQLMRPQTYIKSCCLIM